MTNDRTTTFEERVRRLMHIAGIHCVIRRKRPKYIRNLPQQTAEDILNRYFHAAGHNQKWVMHVTELKYGASQKAYLSAILNLYDGFIRAFILEDSNNNQLVFDTLELDLQVAPESRPCFIVIEDFICIPSHDTHGRYYTKHVSRWQMH